MKFQDSIYGEKKIKKEVIKDLIKTQPLQRLKNIQQAGPQTYFMDKNEVTRFEHSLGVFFLLREYGASTEEQIAGLLHDVPHTAFSHLVDFVFENEDHEYHEEFMEEVIYNSEIPEILEQHGYNTEKILDEERFKLLERDLPALCADRIDYFLRDTTVVREKDITEFLDNLEVKNGNLFILNDKERAEEYALEYIKTDQELWAHPKEVAIFEMFAEAVRKAFETGELSQEDLFKTDKEVYSIIKSIDDEFIQRRIEQLKDLEIELVENEEEADIVTKTKGRAVDPDVQTENSLVKVSSYSDELKQAKKQHLQNVERGYKIKIK